MPPTAVIIALCVVYLVVLISYILLRSDYRKYLPGQVIIILLKIVKHCHLLLGIFSSAIMNNLVMTFTSRLKMDARVLTSSEIGSEWRTILGHPQLVECMSICVLNLAHRSELWGSDVYLHIVKKNCVENFL